MHRNILCADSRANNFDKYEQPADVTIEFVIRRGATISRIECETLKYLENCGVSEKINIKVCIGINDILQFICASFDSVEPVLELLRDKLTHFKNIVLSK